MVGLGDSNGGRTRGRGLLRRQLLVRSNGRVTITKVWHEKPFQRST